MHSIRPYSCYLSVAAFVFSYMMSPASQAQSTTETPPFMAGQIVVKGTPAEFPDYEAIKYLAKSGVTVLKVTKGQEAAKVKKFRSKNKKAFLNLLAHKSVSSADTFSHLQWNFDKVQATEAWTESTADLVTVAVLDTGLATTAAADGVNSCFLDNTVNWDIVNSDNNPDDGDGHGTHVSGTIAQITHNNTGVAGLAYQACIMPIKVLSDSGSGNFADIAEGIYTAVDNGADVINMSLGTNAKYRVRNDENTDAAVDYAIANGVIVVAAAGNDGFRKNVSYPAIYPPVIAVGATDFRDLRAAYSNRGTGLDIMAPGGDSQRDDNNDGYIDGILQETRIDGEWGYWFLTGTSMASPHVAAITALLKGKDNSLTSSEITELLTATALDLGNAGYDNAYGYGLVQAYDALIAIGAYQSPVANFSYSCDDLTCNFDASSSQGQNLSYQWSGDDAIQADGINLSHSFSSAGDYSVLLTIEDDTGAIASSSQQISLVDPAICTDTDGDGYCSIESGGDDCNDNNSAINPGANELSRGKWRNIDRNCNGSLVD